jgi:hypothetical protein
MCQIPHQILHIYYLVKSKQLYWAEIIIIFIDEAIEAWRV